MTTPCVKNIKSLRPFATFGAGLKPAAIPPDSPYAIIMETQQLLYSIACSAELWLEADSKRLLPPSVGHLFVFDSSVRN